MNEEILEGQMSWFSNPAFKISKPIRLIELFAGIGSQAKSLERLGADFEIWKVIEFDKYAIKSYNAVHGTDYETSDVTQIHADDLEIVDTDKFEYIMTYSFPCQDLSVVGNRRGMTKGSGTRSGLLWEVERILNECKELPQVLLMENVPQVHGQKNLNDFKNWIAFLESKGYSNHWKDLSAKDYGIPQSRDRCFMVSILGKYDYTFPKPVDLELRLKDMLDDEVEEKYYLSEKFLEYCNRNYAAQKAKGNSFKFEPTYGEGIAVTINCKNGSYMHDNYIKVPSVKQIGNCMPTKTRDNPNQGRIYDNQGLSPALTCMEGGNRQPMVVDKEATNIGLRIRKLTPKECWRLMGFDDTDFEKAEKVNSNAQLYKQAGNSIVVNVLEAIFGQML